MEETNIMLKTKKRQGYETFKLKKGIKREITDMHVMNL